MMKGKIIVVVLMLIFALAILPAHATITQESEPPQPANDDIEWWPMFHHDVQLTGFTPAESPDTNKILWTNQIESDVWFSSPAIVQDDLLIGIGERYGKHPSTRQEAKEFYDTHLFMKDTCFTDLLITPHALSAEAGKLYHLNANTGDILWDFVANGSVFSSPVIDNGLVYFVSTDSSSYLGELYCLDIDSGDEVWSLPVMTGFATPTIDEGNLYLQTIDPDNYNGTLLCLNAATGEELWNHTIGYIDFSLYTAPALANGKVFFTSIDVTTGIHCKLTCLDQSTGQLLWATKMSEMNFGYALSSPVITTDNAYVISADTEGVEDFWCVLSCFDTTNGSILWNYTMKEDTTDELAFSSPAVAYGNVYFACVGSGWTYGKVICLDADTGAIQWVRKSNDAYTASSPVISEGKVFIGGVNLTLFEGNLYCLDAYTGEPLYKAFIENGFIDSTPAIAAETLYLCSQTGRICAFQDAVKIGDIKGGLATVKIDLSNVGADDVENIQGTMTVTGGIFDRINMTSNYSISILESQTTDTIRLLPVLGFGKIQVTVTVEMTGVNTVVKKAEGFVLGIFVIIL